MKNFVKNIQNNEKYFNKIFYLLIFFVIITGILIRTRFYLAAIPMWLDEYMLASSFLDRAFGDIFTPLDAFQKAPPFFFLLVLTLKKIFGVSELVLRFIPFVLSISSLFLFFLLLKKCIINKTGILAGMLMFTFCVPLIYFSAEFKPYGCDVFFSILLLLLSEYIDFKNLNTKKIIIYTISAICFVYLSFPTVFIIPAIILSNINKNNKFDIRALWILFGILMAGILLFLYDFKTYLFLKDYWGQVEDGFRLGHSLNFIRIFICNGCKYYIYNFNSLYTPVIIFLLLAGAGIMYKQDKNKIKIFILIFTFALIASLLNAYPLNPKLALYMLPIFILLISKIFDMSIYLKVIYQKFIFNIAVCIILITIIGINIPYFNMSEENLVYYNKSLPSRNKSVEDRTKVKEYSLELLKNLKSDDVIFASEEFVYVLKYYNYKYKFNKKLNIIPFSDKPKINRLNIYTIKEHNIKLVELFLSDKDKPLKYWFISRNNENYFISLSFDEIKKLIKHYDIKYKTYQYDNLFLIYTEYD